MRLKKLHASQLGSGLVGKETLAHPTWLGDWSSGTWEVAYLTEFQTRRGQRI